MSLKQFFYLVLLDLQQSTCQDDNLSGGGPFSQRKQLEILNGVERTGRWRNCVSQSIV